MVEMYPFSVGMVLIILAYYFFLATRVGKARGTYNVAAPSCTGPDEFNRIYRVHQNTMEQLVLFLPLMTMFALIAGDQKAAIAGLIWLVGRVMYGNSYVKDPTSRGRGLIIAMLATALCFLGILYYGITSLV